MSTGTGTLDPAIWRLLIAAWIVAMAATLGALFIGEVMGQAPCVLCWYQRAFMFPLAVVLAVACFMSDARAWRYALPLAAGGGLVAGYHSLVYLGLVPEELPRCGAGPSCEGADMTLLGIVPLPLLSLFAFSVIGVIMVLVRNRSVG